MSGNATKRSRLREQAITALITQPTIDAASKHTGVAYSTLVRWMKEPTFAEALKTARNELLQTALDKLKSSALEGVNILIEVARNPASNESARVTAAKALIDYALRIGAIEDMATRVEMLERNLIGDATSTNGFEGSGKTLDGFAASEPSAFYQIQNAKWGNQNDS